jgi:hypothetical protein
MNVKEQEILLMVRYCDTMAESLDSGARGGRCQATGREQCDMTESRNSGARRGSRVNKHAGHCYATASKRRRVFYAVRAVFMRSTPRLYNEDQRDRPNINKAVTVKQYVTPGYEPHMGIDTKTD